MKIIIRFVAILTACLVVASACWDSFVVGKLYHCTDEIGFGLLSPGDWVHEDVAAVPKIDPSATMSEPDQILTGWSIGRLRVLWLGMIGASLLVSGAGCLVGRSQSRSTTSA